MYYRIGVMVPTETRDCKIKALSSLLGLLAASSTLLQASNDLSTLCRMRYVTMSEAEVMKDVEDRHIYVAFGLSMSRSITRRRSPWVAQTKFPMQKRSSGEFRVVHDFIPLNEHPLSLGYPMHGLEEVLHILIKAWIQVFFSLGASYGYWTILTTVEDRNKTHSITSNGHWVYNRMEQGLRAVFAGTGMQTGIYGPEEEIVWSAPYFDKSTEGSRHLMSHRADRRSS